MAFTRKNVWDLGDIWAPEILWYARGVKAMQARPLANPNGWRFWGAIHGFEETLWQQLKQWSPAEAMPAAADVQKFWEECQHASWFFLPWHRGYLIAFEAQIRAAIKSLGGPADVWALPYWNYFKPNQNLLPRAFATADWPDGKGDNPLFVEQRYGPDNDGNVYVDLKYVDLKAISDDRAFIGAWSGTPAGFGGPQTRFEHGNSGTPHGGLEHQPHDMVHGLVGGGDENKLGMMSFPDSAGLDPIFWLHHCNVDRLWDVWARNPANKGNPKDKNNATEKRWLDGPKGIGQRPFLLPMPDGSTWSYTPEEMTDPAMLDYVYDELTPLPAAPAMVSRLEKFGLDVIQAHALLQEVRAMSDGDEAELLGASHVGVPVVGKTVSTSLTLRPAVQNKFAESLSVPLAARLPDRVFLNLENITGLNDAAIFQVFIEVPAGEDPEQHPDLLAGSIALFGVRGASNPDRGHAGEGLSFSMEISSILDRLHLSHDLAADQLHVTLVARQPVSEDAKIRIGRISVYRQGA